MVDYGIYMLKVSVCLLVFYTFFIVALRNSTFFVLNRFYLLIGLLLSFIIPVLRVTLFESNSTTVLSDIIPTNIIEPDISEYQTVKLLNIGHSMNYPLIIAWVYFSGIAVLLFKLLLSILKTIRLKNSAQYYQVGIAKVLKVEALLPFSFFNFVFLPKYETNELILKHELAHIKQFHWFDLIIGELASIVLWFNPFVFLYTRSMKLQHEYLSDLLVVKNETRVDNYLRCMLQHIKFISSGGLSSHFYCKTIKKRVVMITKNKTSKLYLSIYLLVLPITVILFIAFSCNSNPVVSKPNIISKIDAISNGDSLPSVFPVDKVINKKYAGYGWRFHPIYKIKVFHAAIDFPGKMGEFVRATGDGIVQESVLGNKGPGNYILIKHTNEFSTFYSHLAKIIVKPGDVVKKGQLIGYIGNTGMSTGPHLHYEVIKNRKQVNPSDYMPKMVASNN